MVEEPFRFEDFELGNKFTVSPCAFFIREKRDMVEMNNFYSHSTLNSSLNW